MKSNSLHLYQNEEVYRQEYLNIAGIDEAGRGPIAGPVVIAAVILSPQNSIDGINDSKKLTAKQREEFFNHIVDTSNSYSIVEVSHQRIDQINILQAVLEGMKTAAMNLIISPDLCLIDGNKIPDGFKYKAISCIKGDATFATIAAASILAKVHRDQIMIEQDLIYPQYGFAEHKGYPTKQHLHALKQFGPCPIHRMSYGPIRKFAL